MLGGDGMKGRLDRADMFIVLRFMLNKAVLWQQRLPRNSVVVTVASGKLSFPLKASFVLPEVTAAELNAIRFVICSWDVLSINPIVETYEELISCGIGDFTMAGGLFPGGTVNFDSFALNLPL